MWRVPLLAAFIVILLIVLGGCSPTRNNGQWGKINSGVADQMRR